MKFSGGVRVAAGCLVALALFLVVVGGEALASHSLSLSKTADAATVNAGGQIGYTLTVTNGGASAATKVQLTDKLPSNAGTSWRVNPAKAGCVISSGTLSCSFGNLAVGRSASVHIVSPTTAATCGTVNNSASVTSTSAGSATVGPVPIAVKCAVMQITKNADNAVVNREEQVGFTITVANIGTVTGNNVHVSDTLSNGAGLSWSMAAAVSGCSLSSANPQVLGCTFTTITPGSSQLIHLISPTTLSTPCGTDAIPNTASVTLDNGAGSHASASISPRCKNLPVIVTQLSSSSITPTESLDDKATVSGASSNATGSVDFYVYSGSGADACVQANFMESVDGDGPIGGSGLNGEWHPTEDLSFAVKPWPEGSYEVQAVYAGDANNLPVKTACGSESFTVARAQPVIVTQLSSSSITPTESLDDKATVSGASSNATGSVDFYVYSGSGADACVQANFMESVDGDGPIGGSGLNGEWHPTEDLSFAVKPWPEGSYEVQAVYAGDANNLPVKTACGSESFTVARAQPVIVTQLSSSSITPTESLDDKATVSGASSNATGSVDFYVYSGSGADACVQANFMESVDGDGPIGGSGLNGEWHPTEDLSFAVKPWPEGSYEVQAVYAGDANNLPVKTACGSESFTVARAQPVIVTQLSSSSITPTESLDDKATVSGASSNATGSVDFYVYSGSGADACVQANFMESVDGDGPIGGSGLNGEWHPTEDLSFAVKPWPEGSYEVQAVYAGDANNLPVKTACGSESFTVARAQPVIVTQLSSSSITPTESLDDKATVSGASSNATGSVDFYVYSGSGADACVQANFMESVDGDGPIGGSGLNGEWHPTEDLSFAVKPWPEGSYEVQAVYAGDANNLPVKTACGSESFTVTG